MITKEIPCPVCEGRGFVNWCNSTTYGSCQAGSTTCPHCNGSGIREVPMTNADRIRAMTDEELGIFLGEWAAKPWAWKRDGEGECLEWLKQPAKEGE